MQIVAMTGLSYPTVRSAIDLYEAGGWSAVRPALRGRSRGDGRVLSQAQEDVIQRMIIDKRPEQLNMYFNIEAVNEVVARMNPDQGRGETLSRCRTKALSTARARARPVSAEHCCMQSPIGAEDPPG